MAASKRIVQKANLIGYKKIPLHPFGVPLPKMGRRYGARYEIEAHV
jgi:hypothetical protein